VLRGAWYRLTDPVQLHGVIRWKKGPPVKRDAPWFLITDLPGNAAALTELYARRRAVAELFRDDKGLGNGWALRLTKLTRAGRFDRLLVVLALAHWLLVGLGLLARQQLGPAHWGSSNDPEECSAFTVGRGILGRLDVAPASAVAAVAAATIQVAANWGWRS
jgi:hypothetical protein